MLTPRYWQTVFFLSQIDRSKLYVLITPNEFCSRSGVCTVKTNSSVLAKPAKGELPSVSLNRWGLHRSCHGWSSHAFVSPTQWIRVPEGSHDPPFENHCSRQRELCVTTVSPKSSAEHFSPNERSNEPKLIGLLRWVAGAELGAGSELGTQFGQAISPPVVRGLNLKSAAKDANLHTAARQPFLGRLNRSRDALIFPRRLTAVARLSLFLVSVLCLECAFYLNCWVGAWCRISLVWFSLKLKVMMQYLAHGQLLGHYTQIIRAVMDTDDSECNNCHSLTATDWWWLQIITRTNSLRNAVAQIVKQRIVQNHNLNVFGTVYSLFEDASLCFLSENPPISTKLSYLNYGEGWIESWNNAWNIKQNLRRTPWAVFDTALISKRNSNMHHTCCLAACRNRYQQPSLQPARQQNKTILTANKLKTLPVNQTNMVIYMPPVAAFDAHLISDWCNYWNTFYNHPSRVRSSVIWTFSAVSLISTGNMQKNSKARSQVNNL